MEDTRRLSEANPQRRLSLPSRVPSNQSMIQTGQSVSKTGRSRRESTRRVSIYESVQSHSVNKEQLSNNIKRIVEFLSTRNYPHPISPTVLRTLPISDFEFIVRFLLSHIDRNLNPSGNIKEYFPRIMKTLGYPFQFKPSIMNSFNIPYYLPTFIAALRWLTQLASYVQETTELYNQKKETSESLFYETMAQAYNSYMVNGEKYLDDIMKPVRDELIRGNEDLEKEKEFLDMHCRELDDAIAGLTNAGKELPELITEEHKLRKDKRKFEYMITDATHAVEREEKNRKDMEQREIERQKTLGELRQKADAIRQLINEQEFTPEQVAEIRQSYTTWEEKLNAIRSQQHTFANQINQFVVSIDQKAILIDQLITSYHDLLIRLNLLPATSCIANGVDYRLVLEHVEDANSITTRNALQYQRQIVNNSMFKKLEGVLDNYKKALENAISEFQEGLVKYEAKRKKVESSINDQKLAIASLQERSEKLTAKRDELMKQCSSNQSSTDDVIDNAKGYIAELKARNEIFQQEKESLQNQIEIAKREKEEMMKVLDEEEKQLHESIISLLDAISSYKETVDGEIQKFLSFAKSCVKDSL